MFDLLSRYRCLIFNDTEKTVCHLRRVSRDAKDIHGSFSLTKEFQKGRKHKEISSVTCVILCSFSQASSLLFSCSENQIFRMSLSC